MSVLDGDLSFGLDGNNNLPFELAYYNDSGTDITELKYPCNKCGELSSIYCEPDEFDPEYHYCGKNQYCLP